MSIRTVKIAISLPKETMDEVEELRHELHLARSRAILEAVSLWLKKKHEERLIKQYIAAYKTKPENPAGLDLFFKAGLSSFSKDRW